MPWTTIAVTIAVTLAIMIAGLFATGAASALIGRLSRKARLPVPAAASTAADADGWLMDEDVDALLDWDSAVETSPEGATGHGQGPGHPAPLMRRFLQQSGWQAMPRETQSALEKNQWQQQGPWRQDFQETFVRFDERSDCDVTQGTLWELTVTRLNQLLALEAPAYVTGFDSSSNASPPSLS